MLAAAATSDSRVPAYPLIASVWAAESRMRARVATPFLPGLRACVSHQCTPLSGRPAEVSHMAVNSMRVLGIHLVCRAYESHLSERVQAPATRRRRGWPGVATLPL